MTKVFICSRYAGEIESNVETARRLCAHAVKQGYNPFAPHLLYPQFLDEANLEDREKGIELGIEILKECDEMWVYTADGISSGMQAELNVALNIESMIIKVFDTKDLTQNKVLEK